MYRASPPRHVPELDKVSVAAVEVLNTDFDADDFVNIERSTVRHSGGFAQGEFALMPDKARYDSIRFLFNVSSADEVVSATLVVWAVGSEDMPYVVGRSTLGADGAFAPVEIDNFQARYFVSVGELTDTATGTTDLSVEVQVQGVYVAPYVRG